MQTELVSKSQFPVFKIIKLGRHKSHDDLLKDLRGSGIFVDEDQTAVLLRQIVLVPTQVDIPLVSVSARDFGFDKLIANRRWIYQRAAECGLALVPAEVGPQLMLQHTEEDKILHIGMEPIFINHPFEWWRIFTILYRNSRSRQLSRSSCNPEGEDLYDYKDLWVFTPRQ